jgi:protoheme IX farnesyltransferase
MMPVVRGEASTRRQMFWYALSLIPVIASLTVFGAAGWIYLVIALAMTVYFASLTFKLMRSSPGSDAMPVFHYSCLYLFGIFGALTLDRMVALIWPSVLF